jgi:hypothetical protein
VALPVRDLSGGPQGPTLRAQVYQGKMQGLPSGAAPGGAALPLKMLSPLPLPPGNQSSAEETGPDGKRPFKAKNPPLKNTILRGMMIQRVNP